MLLHKREKMLESCIVFFININPTSRIALSMLVVTPSPSRLTRQLLIDWRTPLRRLIPFWRSFCLHTSTLSPRGKEYKHYYKRYFKSPQCQITRHSELLPVALPVVSTPFLPARPAICLYVSGSSKRPLKVGVRMMTLRAGRLTPDERVEVAARTLINPWRKAPSSTSRSSNVNPAQWNVLNHKLDRLHFSVDEGLSVHRHGGRPPPMEQCTVGWDQDQLEFASAEL